MTFQITPQTTVQDIEWAKNAGAFGAKVYPLGVTTNSQYGIEDFYDSRFRQILKALEDYHLPLLLHCEKPGANRFESEREFLPIFEDIVGSFKYLRVVFEHVSTSEGIKLVRELSAKKPGRVFGTLTLHHATLDWTSAFECDRKTIKNPHLLCKPVLNRPEDRDAVLEAMLSGESCFGFGSDSAPHLREAKEGPNPPSGIFTPPEVAYALLAELFVNSSSDSEGRLTRFACLNATRFHCCLPPSRRVKLVKNPWRVPDDKQIYFRDKPEQLPAETRCISVVPLRAGQILSWKVQ
jgi:dihydroorotase